MLGRVALQLRWGMAALSLAVTPVFVPSSAYAQSMLASGQPPLTREMVDQLSAFYSWALDVPLTRRQYHSLETVFTGFWEQHDQGRVDATLNLLTGWSQIRGYSAIQRQLLRYDMEDYLLGSSRQQPSDPLARWILRLYDARSHRLADGVPPLTRQATDAFTEALFFMASEGQGNRPLTPSDADYDAVAQVLATVYPTLEVLEQSEFAQVPSDWGRLWTAWARLSPEQRVQQVQQWSAADAFSANPVLSAPTSPDFEARPPEEQLRDIINNGTLTTNIITNGPAWTIPPFNP